MAPENEGPADRPGQLVLLALCDPASVTRLSADDLDLTLRLMRKARLLGRLAFQLREAGLLGGLPQVVADQLLSALVAAEARQRAARWEMDRLAWALEDMPDIPLVALKGGGYLLAGTPNAAGRTLTDVDLLVPEARLGDVEKRLNSRGWQTKQLTPYDEQYYRAWAHELPPLVHVERSIEVDLHHNILMRTARLKPSSALLLEAAREVPGLRFNVLAPADMVLHAMTHLLYGGEMDDALRELVDIDDLLKCFTASDPNFWDQLWHRAEALDLVRPAFYGLRFARRILGTPVPDAVTVRWQQASPPAPIRGLMDYLVPGTLLPNRSGLKGHRASAGRSLLLARSHWVKMPPLLLLRHLSIKSYRRFRSHG